MNNKEAIRLATEHASRKGHAIKDYFVSSVTLEGSVFIVSLEGRKRLPGNHITVYVDAPSGQVIRLVPGR